MYRLSRLMLILALIAGFFSLVMVTFRYSGLIFLAVFVLIGIFGKRSHATLTAFGTARWASVDDLRSKGMLGATKGLIIGRAYDEGSPSFILALYPLFNSKVSSQAACEMFVESLKFGRKPMPIPDLVRLPNAVHTMVCAPTGVGKGVSCVIPFLLTCPESVVVVDFKGENAERTAEHRRKVFGHRIVLLDVLKLISQNPATLNPLDQIKKDSPTVLEECRDLATALVSRNPDERDPHWADSAILWITALIAVVVWYGESNDRSLQTVRTLLTNPGQLEMAISLMCSSDAFGGMLKRLGGQLRNYTDKELNSTLTTTNRFLNFLDSPAVFESTKSSNFNPEDLLDGKTSIYLILPPASRRSLAPLLRMWIVSMLGACVRGGLQEKNKVHFVLDEAASLEKMEAIDDAIDKFRGYGIRLIFIFQSLGQLKKCFPEDDGQTLLSNVTQLFFGVNDLPTAEYVSNRLGDGTIVVNSGGSGTGNSRQNSRNGENSSGSSSNASHNWNQHGRKLLTGAEVLSLPARMAITFTPGVPPVYTELVRYYEESFSNRQPTRIARIKAIAKVTYIAAALLLFSVCGLLICFQENESEPRVRRVSSPNRHPFYQTNYHTFQNGR